MSSEGRVRSKSRIVHYRNGRACRLVGREMRLKIKSDGYVCVLLSDGARRKQSYVHRMVATAFCEGRANAREVNHINSDRADNRAVNLEWVTREGNALHAHNMGRRSGMTNPKYKRKLTADAATEMRERGANGETYASLADRFGVSEQMVWGVLSGRYWMPPCEVRDAS